LTLSKRISASSSALSSWVDLLRWRVTQQPGQRAYTFLTDGEIERDHLSYADLDVQARMIGALLQKDVASGTRALLVYPSGLEFIAAFFGCLYSGIIAVPVYPPSAARSDRTLAKFHAIVNDAQPAVILTTSSLSARVDSLLSLSPESQAIRVVVTDALTPDLAEDWQVPAVQADTLAFLQYTSGSTGLPKGVMVTHGNLLHNSSLVERYCLHPEEAHGVTWLPLYHDLGLIGGVLQPLYAGYESTIMSPTAFLQRPIRWLQAVSRKRATISGGPNFAYDLCVRKVSAEQKKTLDLSHWEIVANGAEPVRAETLERFSDAFAVCGFRRNYFYPCYGLAEATLVVSAGTKGVFPTVKTFQGKELEQNQALEAIDEDKDNRTLVSIGASHADQRVVIVDPETHILCPPGRVGEIWVAGPSVAQGYWQQPEETASTFHACLADGNEGPFLRTGDLGFLLDGELFITGRLKDLIIIRGSNHYPQDIELTVEKAHPALRPACGVACSVDIAGQERLVIVQEVERQYLKHDFNEVFQAVRQAIAEQHELQVYTIVLIKTGSIPKTSSGKVQRRATRESFLEGSLEIVSSWTLDAQEPQTAQAPSIVDTSKAAPIAANAQDTMGVSSEGATSEVGAPFTSPPNETKSLTAIRSWLVAQVATTLKVKPQEVDVQTPFAHYGMDSLQAVSLSSDLEEWLGRDLSPTLVYDYPNIEALARHLAGVTSSTELVQKDGSAATEAIAIIGLGCRFPGAKDQDAFWQMLRNGVDGITEVPANRWDLQQFYDPERATPGKMNTRWGGFLEDVDQFDPYFFGISPREASRMDPQQRLLLEVAWESLENAGIAVDRLAGSQTGVFVGISGIDYARLQFSDPSYIDAYAGTGNAHSIAANRISYLFDLRGPSMAVDTACSSSLLSVHLACQSLRNGECDLALAGGVNLILTPELTITFSQARMMSEDGHCKTFDDAADGYVRSEGCGLVVLKPLSAAQRDGDRVLAVIRGSAVNQDGRSNGLTAPNGPSQEAVIRQALRNAGVTAEQISYVETHGSSTPLGDPIEYDALKAVLMRNRTVDQPCVLGSVKTNIGHLEAAAGIAGLIKTVLSLYHGEIPPHLHLKKLNQHISLEGTTFSIPTERRPWPTSGLRLAGVSAFGFGGTNVHVVLEEGPQFQPAIGEVERSTHVLALSGQSEQALKTLARRYVEALASQPALSLTDLCYTANSGRSHFAHRLALVAGSTTQLREQLSAFAADQLPQGVHRGRVTATGRPRVAFLFTGQGSQYYDMARQLYETQPIFRETLDKCEQILRSYLEEPLLSVIYPEAEATSSLHETAYTQPALFALEYALAEMWRSWGLEPDIVMGHSVGEYVAACVAGMFSLEDGLKLIAARGRLMQELPERGEMAVLFADQSRVARTLAPFKDQVSIAAVNGPQNTVISGSSEAVKAIVQRLEAEGIITHPMVVSHAFHSPLMEPMLPAFEQMAQQVHYAPLRIPLVSNLTGRVVDAGEMLNASYWRQHTRSAVQFATGIQALAELGYELFVEVGPQPILSNMGRRCLPTATCSWLPSLRQDQDNWQVLLGSVAALYVKGVRFDWFGFDRDYVRHRVALPTYPFEREYCWLESASAVTKTTAVTEVAGATPDVPQVPIEIANGTQRHPLLASHVELVFPTGVHVWETALDKQRLPYLSDHRIQGAMAAPVSLYVEMAQAATVEVFGPGAPHAYRLSEIELKKLLLLPEQGAQKVQVVLSSDANEHVLFHVYSHSVGVPDQPRHLWTLHASGKIRHN
jgi:acyl transferase domain-containing protein/acyl-CoA synthetase (AMP-forming)/AMP-acid ligase II/acyl carrier protein